MVLPSPLRLWTMLGPSMMQAEGSGNVSVCEALFSMFLASAALSVLCIESSLFASDHHKGPSGCARTSLTGRALLSAMTIIWVFVWLQSNLLPWSFNTSWCFRDVERLFVCFSNLSSFQKVTDSVWWAKDSRGQVDQICFLMAQWIDPDILYLAPQMHVRQSRLS